MHILLQNYTIFLKTLGNFENLVFVIMSTKKIGNIYALSLKLLRCLLSKIVSEYDQEIPQSQTTDNPVAP